MQTVIYKRWIVREKKLKNEKEVKGYMPGRDESQNNLSAKTNTLEKEEKTSF